MKSTRSWMVPFLQLFGIVHGNGLSPFATSINTPGPGELSALFEQFFKNPKQNRRGRVIALDGNDLESEDEEELF